MVKAKLNRLLIDKLKAECSAQDSFVAAYREKQAAVEGATDPDLRGLREERRAVAPLLPRF